MLPENNNSLQKENRTFKITIDGPAASGKTTTARKVAETLGFLHLDSGSLYRAATLKVLQTHTPIDDQQAVADIIRKSTIDLITQDGRNKVLLDGIDVTENIRLPEISNAVSKIASMVHVRKILSEWQRTIAKSKNIVVEGRDTGTVVFPDAQLKIFMSASLEDRVQRRYKELTAKGVNVDADQLRREIVQRDWNDEEREHSPLKRPDDAIDLDTTNMTIDTFREQKGNIRRRGHSQLL